MGIKKKNDDYLMHYGVKGMKWGVRRAQKSNDKTASKCRDNSAQDKASRRKKVIAIGASVVALSLAAYGTYKFGQVKAAKIQAGNAAVDALMDSLRNSSQMFSGSTKVNKLVFGDSDSKILSNGKKKLYEAVFDANRAKRDAYNTVMNKKPKGVKNVVQILRNEPRKKIDQDKVNKYLGKFSQDSIKRELKETEIIKDIASKTGRDPIDVMQDRVFDSIIDAIKKGPAY